MNILVIAPMHSEFASFNNSLASIPHKNHYKVVEVGVGKVNAAANTAIELYGNPHSKGYDLIAVIGYAAASSNIPQGSFVIPLSAKYYDTDCPDSIIELSKTYELQGQDDIIILTGDSFVTAANVTSINRSTTSTSIVYDMETAAVCQVAEETPVIALKLISDNPSSNNLQSFTEFVKTHSNFSQFVYYLESISSYL